MRAEAEGHISQRVGITVLERIVMINLYLAVVTLLVWYVFFAGAPLGKHVPNGHAGADAWTAGLRFAGQSGRLSTCHAH